MPLGLFFGLYAYKKINKKKSSFKKQKIYNNNEDIVCKKSKEKK